MRSRGKFCHDTVRIHDSESSTLLVKHFLRLFKLVYFHIMALAMLSFLLLCTPIAIWSQSYVSLDGASASSAYSTGAFSADQALSAGAGYWCRFILIRIVMLYACCCY